MTSLLSLPPRLDIAAKFTTEARYALTMRAFFDADNGCYGKSVALHLIVNIVRNGIFQRDIWRISEPAS
ncbi:hypothetical protein ECC18A13_p20050 (plasmid) [Enterobacter sp. 18A13]|nr:hypothetical protein ECC18A13_p20050 [Enterobacter sp. 18A13]